MASPAYNAFIAQVKKDGGRVAPSPKGVLSSAFPYTIWGPFANAHTWPLPNEYSVNGQTGYYHAPTAIQTETKTFSLATRREVETGSARLMKQWGIPVVFQSLSNYAKTLALIGVVVGAVFYYVNRQRSGTR